MTNFFGHIKCFGTSEMDEHMTFFMSHMTILMEIIVRFRAYDIFYVAYDKFVCVCVYNF